MGRLIHVSEDGETVDTLLTFPFRWATRPSGAVSWQPLLLVGPVYATSSEGKVVTGIPDQYRVEVRSPAGTLETAFSKPSESSSLSDAERTALIERGRSLFEERLAPLGELDPNTRAMIAAVQWGTPDRLPVFSALVGGPDETIWVRRVLPVDSMTVDILNGRSASAGAGSATWDVFSQAGRLLGSLTLPNRFDLRRIKGDFIYGVAKDDLDVQTVTRLRIRRPGAVG